MFVFVVFDFVIVSVLCSLLVVVVIGYCSCYLYKFLFFVIDVALVRCYCSLFLILF